MKKIAILCDMDAYANSIRPVTIKTLLEKEGHQVFIVNGTRIRNSNIVKKTDGRTSHTSKLLKQKLFADLQKICMEFFEKHVTGMTYYYYFILKIKLRSLLLMRVIKKENFDIIICENSIQAYITLQDLHSKTILDLDSPLVDELYYSGKLTDKYYSKLLKKYIRIYEKADYLNFQWYKYTEYTKKHIYNGKNIIEVNFGCTPKDSKKRATYDPNPKIICLGYLGGSWVNLPLLSKLSRLYPIDVYGGPEPDKKYGLNYKGYAPTTDVIKDYQFGLITISKDKLRRSSFSSKHLEYISYGLPVLTPEWRKDKILKDVSIYYNTSNFINKIKHYTKKAEWLTLSNMSYNTAKSLQWHKTLKPLITLVNNMN